MNHNDIKIFGENFSLFLKTFNRLQQQKISLPASLKLNSKRRNNPRLKTPNRLICAHSSMNPVRNKFELLSDITKSNIDILMISGTKLDSPIPNVKSMAILKLIDLTVMEMVVEYLYLSARIYQQK